VRCPAVGIGRAAVPLFFGVALTVITAIQLTETKFARGNESAQRQLAGFYLYDDISLTRSAIDHLIKEKNRT